MAGLNQLNYTYKQYLERWQDKYGEATVGETYVNGPYGHKLAITINRLSKKEFKERMARLVALDEMFDEALKSNDSDGMDDALARGLNLELWLLL